jgi:NADH-quinone oxidoreductase subunit J
MQISLTSLVLMTFTAATAIAAMSLRNIVHCALAIALAFLGFAALYLELGAQFIGFAQILIYVGAVAILIVFAILLTRSTENLAQGGRPRINTVAGMATAIAAFVSMGVMISKSNLVATVASPRGSPTVRQFGDELMSRYILPLEILGLLLTAAMIGAVIIALRDKRVE